jgi:cell division FtsZ-interacting protein ZapD
MTHVSLRGVQYRMAARKQLLDELCQTQAMTERQKYLRLLSIVIEDLPTSAIDALIRKDYEASASMLNNVRIGRVHNLGHLIALVRIGLPKYQVPAELLPVPMSVPLLAE